MSSVLSGIHLRVFQVCEGTLLSNHAGFSAKAAKAEQQIAFLTLAKLTQNQALTRFFTSHI